MKEARAFVESGKARKNAEARRSEIKSVAEGIQKWLDICEKEGRNGREPVTRYTLDNREYRAEIIKKYALMGHRSIETTLNVYGHLIERAEAASDRVSALSFVRRVPCGESVASAS